MGEEQQGFRRGTMDEMFTLRQLMEKRMERQENVALEFIELEKAYDTVPREMVMATLRWMGRRQKVGQCADREYRRNSGWTSA